MNATSDLDVIIVGSGAASAHELAHRGLRVADHLATAVRGPVPSRAGA